MPDISSVLELPLAPLKRVSARHGSEGRAVMKRGPVKHGKAMHLTEDPALSAMLRSEGADAHAELERNMNLPAGIKTRGDYISCLGWFFGLFHPLENQLGGFPQWAKIGIDFEAHRRAELLVKDLAALGTDANSFAAADFPYLASFSEALGALYVLEGSALGGKVILKNVESRLGDVCAGATTFFSGPSPDGRGNEAEANGALSWPRFKAVIDAYGQAWPSRQPLVVSGALKAFAAFAAASGKLRK